MGKKNSGDVEIEFKKMFPRLSATGTGLKKFGRCRKLAVGYVTNILMRAKKDEVEPLDFITREKEVRDELRKYAEEVYPDAEKRYAPVSHLKRLAIRELDLANGTKSVNGVIRGEIDLIINLEGLKPHIRYLWLKLGRVGQGIPKIDQTREDLELTVYSKVFFKAILEVDMKFNTSSVEELVIDHYRDLKEKIAVRVKRKYRKAVLQYFRMYVNKRLGLKTRKNRPALKLEQLPPLLKKQILKAEKLLKLGLGTDKELAKLATKYEFESTEPLSPRSIAKYRTDLLKGAAYFELPEQAGIRDLLLVVPKEGTEEFYNPYVERLREVERAVERPRKRLNKDSVDYAGCITAICTFGRANGIFDLQENFHKWHSAKLDRKAQADWRTEKKAKMPRVWLDGEFDKLVNRFEGIIETKSLLVNREDLELCLFLPEYVTMRYLGFRQQCLRHCDQGKNINFPKKGSVSFSYEAGEIKNEIPISQTLSLREEGEEEGLKILLEVLLDYKFKFLDVLRSLYPTQYAERMGDAFFGVPDFTEGGCGVRRCVVGDKESDDHIAYSLEEKKGMGDVYEFFAGAADHFMDTDHLIGTDIFLNPHFLRGVCVDWMKDDLKMTWEEIEEAVGDTEETLKKHYYGHEKRIQNLAKAFSRIIKEKKAEKKKGEDSSVLHGSLHSMQESFKILTEQSVRNEERATRAEQRAAAAEERMTMVEEQARRFEKGESYWRGVAEFLMNKTGVSISDLPPELQLLAAA
jgi:F0F1-type ATP synthase epsilon subunit